MKRSILTLSLFLFIATTPESKASNTDADEALWSHLQRRSGIWYKQYIKENGVAVNTAHWKTPIERAFIRLANASGHKPFNVEYVIINNKRFNASAFPGGQFIIHLGALQEMEGKARKDIKADGTEGEKRGIDWYRERMIAPLLAHELSHYYNRHTFFAIKRYWSYTGKQSDEISMDMIKYSQENELDADLTGYLILKRAGYNPDSMIDLLNFLNDLSQRQKGISAYYFSSHPSPHTRLAALDHKGKGLHAWASLMERTFDDIQFGKNLKPAIETLEDALKKYPDNVHLLKAHAVALHKLWLSTVPLRNQRLKAIIGLPAFRDDMVFRKRRARGVSIGNRRYYNRALKAYREAIDRALDPEFQSNFGVLLCYSSDTGEKKRGAELAFKAAKKQPTTSTLSNLALVEFIAGEQNKSIKLLSGMARVIDENYTKKLAKSATDAKTSKQIHGLRDYIRKCQIIDREYVYTDFTPILNLALAMHYAGESATAKAIAHDYLQRYDSRSAWAKHLSRITGVKMPEAEKSAKPLFINGIKVGDSIKKVLETWKNPSKIVSDITEREFWYYEKTGMYLMVEMGQVHQMIITSSRSPKVGDKFGVGTSRLHVEKILGKHKSQSGLYYLYGEDQGIVIRYVLGIADKIIIMR